MGYCPYFCIVCEDIEDNGWFTYKDESTYIKFIYEFGKNEVKTLFKLNIDLTNDGFEKNEIVYTYSICLKCSRKFRYKKDKLNGSCLKMHTKRKIDGKWIQDKYEHIK